MCPLNWLINILQDRKSLYNLLNYKMIFFYLVGNHNGVSCFTCIWHMDFTVLYMFINAEDIFKHSIYHVSIYQKTGMFTKTSKQGHVLKEEQYYKSSDCMYCSCKCSSWCLNWPYTRKSICLAPVDFLQIWSCGFNGFTRKI